MFAEIFTLVIDTVSSLYLMLILLRFILQLSRADFYNPISQFVVKATNPLLIPLRRIVPSIGGIDTSSLVLAVLFQLLVLVIKMLVLGGGLGNPVFLLALSGLFLMCVFACFTLIVLILRK